MQTGTRTPLSENSQQKPVQRTIEELRVELLADHKELKNWRAVSDNKWHLPPGTLNRIAKNCYEPKDPAIRSKLGLPLQSLVISVDGSIPDGTLALTAQQCACGQYFISNHPLRRKCFICSPFRKRKKKE